MAGSSGLAAATGTEPPVAVSQAVTSISAGVAERADGRAGEPDEGESSADGETDGLEKTIRSVHGGVSSAVERSARRIDAFFADDRVYTDSTESYARLSLQNSWESGEDTRSEARVRLRVDLPGTRERLRLFVEGGDPDDVTGEGSDSIPNALDDNDYNIGLEGQIRGTGRWDLRPGVGVKAAGPADPFVRLRAIRYAQPGDWLMRFAAGAAEYLDDGTELQTRLDFDRRINPKWLFRSASRLRYLDSKDRVEARQQLTLFHKLSGRVGLAYDLGLDANDDPDWDVDRYFTQLRARFRAYEKWLFVELKPELLFREEDDYDPSFRFSLRVDFVFGARYR
ncbi:MAG: hypothetical protein PVG91_09700 [Gammaproteobacteria bacterium]|jgi:hypothetical protein